MKFVTLLKIVGGISVIISIATIGILLQTYLQTNGLNIHSSAQRIESRNNTTANAKLDKKFTKTANTTNMTITTASSINATTPKTIAIATTDEIIEQINEIARNDDPGPGPSKASQEKDENLKMFILTTTRGYGLNGIFVFTQIIAGLFLTVVTKKDARVTAYTWMIVASASTTITTLTLIEAVRIHSKVMDDDAKNVNHANASEKLFGHFNFISSYYIISGVYILLHMLGVSILLCFMRTPTGFNYKSLKNKTSA